MLKADEECFIPQFKGGQIEILELEYCQGGATKRYEYS